ncbi:MAG: hypothetical protein R2705_01535 [Ilumatobacteraceae bacterium]
MSVHRRIVVGLTCVTLFSSVAAVPAAHAVDGPAVTTPATLYIGDVAEIAVVPTDQTGSYVVDLYQASTRIARIASGDDITALETVRWPVSSRLKLGGDDYKIVVDTPAGDPFSSDPFTFAAPHITDVVVSPYYFWSDADPEQLTTASMLDEVLVTWDSAGVTGDVVNLFLTDGTKKKAVAKKTENDGSEIVTLPAKSIEADQAYSMLVVPTFKPAEEAQSAEFTVTAPREPMMFLERTTARIGETLDVNVYELSAGATATWSW